MQVHSKRKVVLAVNKCESETKGLEQAAQFWAYGHEPLPVSAISGTGTGELMERLIAVRRRLPVFAGPQLWFSVRC